jgi:hypothetical protein
MSTRPPQMWKVKIGRHAVRPRWLVPARSSTVPAPDADYAIETVVRWAHRDAAVPPLRSLIKESVAYASATPVEECARSRPQAAGQLVLFDRLAA